ncbi:MmgE/PrpD family protein [Polaromonas sp. P1-6]|nr:MmgE/PrpD family protein [Polaromonas sp. P1-6]
MSVANKASLSAQMAQFTHGLRLDAIPIPIQHLARLHLIDAMGVGLAAARVPAHRRLLTRLRTEAPGAGAATVFGFSGGAAVLLAALLNGTSIHSLEYDDTHMASIVHGSAVIVPAVLAAAEAGDLSLDDTLKLVVAGWETLVRIGEASPGGFQRRGFQVTSVGGVVIAAMLGAVARGASLDQTTSAMGISGSQAGGIFEFLSNGSNVKALHPGWAAHAGLWAAACAQAGMTGPDTVLEGRFGLFSTYADDTEAGTRLADALQGLGSTWKLADAAFKFYPCCHYIHPYLECAQALLAQAGSVESIASVHCRVAPGAATVICEPWHTKQNVKNGSEAKYSLPYCVARILLGRPVDVPAMTDCGVDAQAVALSDLIHWVPRHDSRFPEFFDADMEITLTNGSRIHHTVAQVLGSLQRPATEAAVKAKFMVNASATLTDHACDALWQSVMQGGPLGALQQALRSV